VVKRIGFSQIVRIAKLTDERVAAIEELDSARIARAIGFTRFPYASPTDGKEDEQGIDEEGSLLRVRGVVKGDKDDGYVVDGTGRKISLPRGSSDAALGPYHIERSQLFVLDSWTRCVGQGNERLHRG
jgi:hypothetical protein